MHATHHNRQYLKTWLMIDVIAAFPFDLLYDIVERKDVPAEHLLRLLKGARFLRLLRILRMHRILKRRQGVNALRIKFALMSLIKFATLEILLAHWLACFWYWLGQLQVSNYEKIMANGLNDEYTEVPWVIVFRVPPNNLHHQYVFSLYWAVTTMTTIGYGDITPSTQSERIFGSFAMLAGAITYAYGITNIVTLAASFNNRLTAFHDLMDQVNDYMKYRKLPRELQGEIVQYFHYLRDNNMIFKEQELLEQFSVSLRNRVCSHVHKDIIEAVPFFRETDAYPGFITDVLTHTCSFPTMCIYAH